jgi:hypothetical protein
MHRLVIALVSLLGLAGAAFLAVYVFLFSASTDRAAALAPAATVVYANIYLQPSAGQQMNIDGLIGRLPGFADDATLDEKVDQAVQNLLAGSGIDYRAQIKAWLGDQVAVAGWPAPDDPTSIRAVVIAQVSDPMVAADALGDIAAESGATLREESYQDVSLSVGDAFAYAFVGDMLVASDTRTGVEAIIDVQRGDEALAGREEFRATMSELPADHLASVFIDLAAIGEATGTEDQLAAASTAGAALVAEPEGLRLSGSAPFDADAAGPSSRAGFALGSEPSSLVDWMPDDTLAELVVFGLRGVLEDAEAAAGATPQGEEVTSALDTIRALAAFVFGIDLDADLLPLLDREVGLAVTGVDATGIPAGQLLLRPEDPDAALAALERIVGGLTAAGADSDVESVAGVDVTVLSMPQVGEIAYAESDGIIILGVGREGVVAALEAHDSGQSLSTSDAYVRTFEVAGERAGNELYVDIGAIADLLADELALPDDARDILAQLGSFGFTAPSRDDQIVFHAVLTVDDPSAPE